MTATRTQENQPPGQSLIRTAPLTKHWRRNSQTVFGQNYDGSYAPLTDASGKLTGALFVGVPK
jgi:hypothetical protein